MPAPAIPLSELQLLEVFSSIQGEGLLVGCRQIFLRLATCNLACAYCDTPFELTANCRVEDSPGSGNFRSIPNPVALDTMIGTLFRWCSDTPGAHHSFSLTGGEPLAQYEVLAEWLPALRRILPVYLETNGTLPEALAVLLDQLDWVAMDIKLASQTGAPTPWERHREFLRLARQRACFVKVVVGEETPQEEVMEAATLVAGAGSDIPLFLQPVTSAGRVALGSRQLLDLQTCAARIHPAVRVVPQTHRFIGLL